MTTKQKLSNITSPPPGLYPGGDSRTWLCRLLPSFCSIANWRQNSRNQFSVKRVYDDNRIIHPSDFPFTIFTSSWKLHRHRTRTVAGTRSGFCVRGRGTVTERVYMETRNGFDSVPTLCEGGWWISDKITNHNPGWANKLSSSRITARTHGAE